MATEPTTPPTRNRAETRMMVADGTTADRRTHGRGTDRPDMRTTTTTSPDSAYTVAVAADGRTPAADPAARAPSHTASEGASAGAPQGTAEGASEDAEDADVDLRHHGDREVAPGLVDLAVNVRGGAPPDWLAERLVASLAGLAAYPDATAARRAVAARHRRPVGDVLLTAGAAEAFVLLARALTPRHALVVHPQFTEPEAALRAAGHTVHRVVLPERDGFGLDPARIPEEADLVVIGNPTNPTSVLHPAETIAALARPGRVLVVDEAFADTIPGEPESLAERSDVEGLVVVRSLTKTWALAGLRIGYLLASADLVRRCAEAQPLWSVSTPALVAAQACSGPEAVAHAAASAVTLATDRAYLVARLRAIPGVRLPVEPRASFVLAHVEEGLKVRELLRERGFAVRRADTFPGLGPDWLRIAVRDRATTQAFAAALEGVLTT